MGSLDRNGTNIEHLCADFSLHIFFYRSILSRICKELPWINRIPNPKLMRCICDLIFSDPFVVIFAHLRGLAGKNTRCFLPYQL